MKKGLKRICSLLIAVAIVLSSISVPSYAATYSKRTQALSRYMKLVNNFIKEQPMGSSKVSYAPASKTARDNLTSSQKRLYDLMYKNARNIKEFEISNIGDKKYNDIGAAYNAFKSDHPEYEECLSFEEVEKPQGGLDKLRYYYYTMGGKKRISTAKEKRQLRKDIKEYTETFKYITDTIVNGMPKDASTIDKYRYIALMLCYSTKYNYKAAELNENGMDTTKSKVVSRAWSMDGAIMYGQAVCGGYALTYKYLCNKAGLYCDYVTGKATRKAQIGHAWNLVKLDTGTYYVDTTWMDDVYLNDYTSYSYFLMTQKERKEDFKIIDENVKATGKVSYRKTWMEMFGDDFDTGVNVEIDTNLGDKAVNWSKSKKADIVFETKSKERVLQYICFGDNTVLPASAYTTEVTSEGLKIRIKGNSKSLIKGLAYKVNFIEVHFEHNGVANITVCVVD